MKISEAKEQSRGVFWIVDNELLAFPFINDSYGVSKSGLTYNHEKLWKELKVGRNIPYNYYPRGRVEFSSSGRPIVWMNPNIDEDEFIPKLKQNLVCVKILE